MRTGYDSVFYVPFNMICKSYRVNRRMIMKCSVLFLMTWLSFRSMVSLSQYGATLPFPVCPHWPSSGCNWLSCVCWFLQAMSFAYLQWKLMADMLRLTIRKHRKPATAPITMTAVLSGWQYWAYLPSDCAPAQAARLLNENAIEVQPRPQHILDMM